MAFDPFGSVIDTLIAPASDLFPITPDDAANLPKAAKAIYVGAGGDINMRAIGSAEDVVLRDVPTGSVLAIRVAAVRMTDTTAADLVGLA